MKIQVDGMVNEGFPIIWSHVALRVFSIILHIFYPNFQFIYYFFFFFELLRDFMPTEIIILIKVSVKEIKPKIN